MNLETLLRNLNTQQVHCYPNEGNAGDGMIQAGLFHLTGRLGITLEMVNYPQESTGKHLLLIGAGCFCAGSWHMVDPVRFYAERFEQVYVLSTTFDATFGPTAKLLRELPANVTVFCRERTSYDAALKLVPRPENIFLDRDLAFHLDVSPWMKAGRGEINCFRTDNESRLRRIPSPNFDVSKMGREYHHTLLLDTLANFETINTDRLHVMIAGALLGKKVRAFDGAYHKNRSVYDYSIREEYLDVTFCGDDEMEALLAASSKKSLHASVVRTLLWLPKSELLRRAYKQYKARRRNGGN